MEQHTQGTLVFYNFDDEKLAHLTARKLLLLVAEYRKNKTLASGYVCLVILRLKKNKNKNELIHMLHGF